MTGPQALIAIAGDLRPKLSNSFQTKLILSSEIMEFFAENAWHVIGLLASLDSFYGIQSIVRRSSSADMLLALRRTPF